MTLWIGTLAERFIKFHCIGCPYAIQERITKGLPGCSSESLQDATADIDHKWGCSSRWVCDYDWRSKNDR